QKLLCGNLSMVRLARVLDEERLTDRVVADDRLEMGRARLDGRQRERNSLVQKNAGGIPGDLELAGCESMGLAPAALGVVAGPVVGDGLDDLVLCDGHVPVLGDRCERRRPAGPVALGYEPEGKPDPLLLRASIPQPLRETVVVSV